MWSISPTLPARLSTGSGSSAPVASQRRLHGGAGRDQGTRSPSTRVGHRRARGLDAQETGPADFRRETRANSTSVDERLAEVSDLSIGRRNGT